MLPHVAYFGIFLCLVRVSSSKTLEPHWGEWSEWSRCSASCGSGTASRKTAWVVNGYSTDYVYFDTVECSSPVTCPIDGHWSMWSEWSACPVMCGGGISRRERWCDSPKPQHGGRICLGERTDVQYCNDIQCPGIPTDFQLSSCNISHFMCESLRYCILRPKHCDGKLHCDDGSDEKGCGNSGLRLGFVGEGSENLHGSFLTTIWGLVLLQLCTV